MQWRRCINLILIGALLVAVGLGDGCTLETRQRILKTVFEDVPPPGEETPPKPFVRPPRRPPLYKPAPPIMIPVKVYQPAFQNDWKGLLRKLPKDDVGGIDWLSALENGDINPRAGIDEASAQAQPVLPMDVQLEPPGQPLFKVTFPHKPHTEWLACDSCHPRIFQMRAGADPINMAKIFAGEYCGQCHGKVAFDVATGCPRCHLALAGPQ